MLAPVWSITLLRRDGGVVVPDLLDGRYSWDTARKVVSGGTFTTATDPGNLLGARASVTVDGQSLGMFSVTSCKPNHSKSETTWRIEWMDDAILLERQILLIERGLAATTPVIAAARQMLEDSGVQAAIADSDRTLRVGVAFNAGQTRLDYVNKLLAAGGLHPLWPSPTGLFARKHIDPMTATVVHEFREGEESLHLPEYPQEQDFLAVPNRLLITSNGNDEAGPLRAVARDVTSSRWSYQARGTWVDARPQTSDAVTQEDLVADGDRALMELQFNAITMNVQHMWNPRIVPGCIVNVVAGSEDVSGRWQVTAGSTEMVGSAALTDSSMRKVIPRG